MEERIKETEIKKLNHCSIVFSVLLVATIVSAVPFTVWIGIYALIWRVNRFESDAEIAGFLPAFDEVNDPTEYEISGGRAK